MLLVERWRWHSLGCPPSSFRTLERFHKLESLKLPPRGWGRGEEDVVPLFGDWRSRQTSYRATAADIIHTIYEKESMINERCPP